MMKHDARSPIQIEHKDGRVEIRCFERPEDERYLCWVMPTQEAEDLARWWNDGGVDLRAGDLPVADCRCRSVAVSAHTVNRIEVRSLDPQGRPSMIGYSLPRNAVAALAAALSRGEASKPNAGKKGSRICSRKSS
ncbi:MAG TPA: hypothetical protein VLI39_02515 [Sedimentisphaerales bacterium]|nr:hypothetical protein [Sedimentisphaerales bacterium]